MSRETILLLIERCKAARAAGASLEDMRERVLPAEFDKIAPQDFLEWVKDDREYCWYYYDAQQSGVCAKPAEAAALILESIVLDALE
jgi:hypothetical protein